MASWSAGVAGRICMGGVCRRAAGLSRDSVRGAAESAGACGASIWAKKMEGAAPPRGRSGQAASRAAASARATMSSMMRFSSKSFGV